MGNQPFHPRSKTTLRPPLDPGQRYIPNSPVEPSPLASTPQLGVSGNSSVPHQIIEFDHHGLSWEAFEGLPYMQNSEDQGTRPRHPHCAITHSLTWQCDEKISGCGQCLRYGRECSGYEISPVLAESSESTTTTVAAKKKKALRPRPSAQTPNCTLANLYRAIGIRQPRQSADHLAACYFISRFVRGRGQRIMRGFLGFVIPLAASGCPEHFNRIFHACSLEAFGTKYLLADSEWKFRSRRLYNRALVATAVALHNPRDACGDATLASVVLLALYESLAGTSLGLYAWNSHINGAIQLLRARGAEQLGTKMGFDLFIATRTLMVRFRGCSNAS